MANSGQQMKVNAGEWKGLPLESSPYVKYSDREEYQSNAYGSQQGQLLQLLNPPNPYQGGGGSTNIAQSPKPKPQKPLAIPN